MARALDAVDTLINCWGRPDYELTERERTEVVNFITRGLRNDTALPEAPK